MKRRVKVLLLLFTLGTLNINAFIYDIYIRRKLLDPRVKKYSYFIGLGDFHDKRDESNAIQRADLDKIISKCCQKDTAFIVEDISSKGFGGKMGCGKFFINSRGGILGGLARKYIAKGFKNFKNIEYRFCRVASLSPLLNNIHINKSFPSSSAIKICCVKNEIAKMLLNIKKYDDGNILNNWYKKNIVSVFTCMKALKLSKYEKLSVEAYVNAHTNKKNRLNFIKKLLVFDSALIDIEIAHAIANTSKKNKVVIAGGSHVKNVSNILKKMGYELLFKSDVSFRNEYDKKKCLGCHVYPGGFCRKPTPADLKILQKYL